MPKGIYQGHNWNKPEELEFKEYYLSHSTEETAAYFKTSISSIQRLARTYKCAKPKAKGWTKKTKKYTWTQEQISKVVSLYEDGYMATQIAQKMNLLRHQVIDILNTAGIQYKPRKISELNPEVKEDFLKLRRQNHFEKTGDIKWHLSEEHRKKLSEIQKSPDFIAKHHEAKSLAQKKKYLDPTYIAPWNTPEANRKAAETRKNWSPEVKKAFREKYNRTMLERYGKGSLTNTEKTKQTIQNWSEEKRLEVHKRRSLAAKEVCSRPDYISPWKKKEVQEKLKTTILQRFGVDYAFQLNMDKHRISNLNKNFLTLLKEYGIEGKLEEKVGNYFYDICIGKILIDLNPSISHNLTMGFGKLTGKSNKNVIISRKYHYGRWLNAKENGYELISIFDWMDKSKVLSLIAAKCGKTQKVFARKCEIKEVSKSDAYNFYEINHVLGKPRGTDYSYGLYYLNELVACMSFKASKDTLELQRFANKSDITVVGGVSKLWSHFIKEHQPKEVVTFTDNNLGNGSVYERLGFELESVRTTTAWYNPKLKSYIRSSSLNQQGADRLIGNKIPNYFPVGLDRDDFIARGGKEEYVKEFKEHADNRNWWPGNSDIAKHYGYLEFEDAGYSKLIFHCNN